MLRWESLLGLGSCFLFLTTTCPSDCCHSVSGHFKREELGAGLFPKSTDVFCLLCPYCLLLLHRTLWMHFHWKNAGCHTSFLLGQLPLGIYQIPLQSSVKVPVDFSKHWSRFFVLYCPVCFVVAAQSGALHFSVSEEFWKMPAPLSAPVLPASPWAPLGLKNVPEPLLSDKGHLLPCLSGCGAEKKLERTGATELFGKKLLESPGNLLLANKLAWQARRAVSSLRIPVSKILGKTNEILSPTWDSCSPLNWSELGCGMRAQHLFSAKLGQTQSLLIPLHGRAHLGTQHAPPWGHQEFDRKSRHYSNLFFVSLSLNTPF